MKHRVAGRKLGRTSAHRLALLRNLSTALFERERITTTLGKAKDLRPFAERLVTLAKRETLHARRQVLRHIHRRDVVAKLFDTISARFAQRPGGYTRIVKLGPRRGDNAEMAIVELIGFEPDFSKKKPDTKSKAKARPAKDEEAGGAEAGTAEAPSKAERKAKEKADKQEARSARAAAKDAKSAKSAKPAKPATKKKSAAGTKTAKKAPKGR
jgi:large subunit ribosomal protein L17